MTSSKWGIPAEQVPYHLPSQNVYYEFTFANVMKLMGETPIGCRDQRVAQSLAQQDARFREIIEGCSEIQEGIETSNSKTA